MKNLQLAISDFAVPAPRAGSIETHSGYGPLPNMGTELHAEIQTQRARESANYQPEKWISHSFALEGYRITVSGRMDGFWTGQPPRLEEIKSTYSPKDLERVLRAEADHPYWLQARTYAYLHFQHTGQLPEAHLHIVSARTRETFDLPVDLDLDAYERWLGRRLAEIVCEAKMFEALVKRRRKTAKSFAFPFPEPRPGQIDLMRTVEQNLNDKTHMLLQAPTGLGKTAGVLYPVLKEAMGRGQKVIYLTPKNSQHAVAEDALRRLQKTGMKVRGLTIQAKAKMCFKDQPVCDPEHCEYAKDYYKKVADHGLIDKVARKKNLTPRLFQKIGREYEVCPFELQLESVPRADVVICDYNYVFSPRNSLGRLSHNGFGKKTSPNLIVDEVHNLPSRATDYFSARLSCEELRELGGNNPHLPARLAFDYEELVEDAIGLLRRVSGGAREPRRLDLDLKTFLDFGARVNEFLSRYLESPAQLQINDKVLRFCELWSEFIGALENQGEEFFCTHTPGPGGGNLKITCCDASAALKESYTAFANVVTFSATVKPFEYYSNLLGFDPSRLLKAEFQSPFPRQRRKLLIIPQISTKYRDREANYGKIKDGIERLIALKPGNYFAFFPSFEFLDRVARILEVPGFEILRQRREMKRPEIEAHLEVLRQPGAKTLFLAVQGGVFSEGLDYPGDMLIGAIIVGPALPTFDFERQMLQEYYAKKHGTENGFDFAFTYPAMAKVVQSAGRVIRSHTDRGLIVLMDRRFTHANYVRSMPSDWTETENLVSQSILQDVRRFWEDSEP
jgi:DNA excision repair protein ERCC-2